MAAEATPSPGGQPQQVEPSEPPPPPSSASALDVTSPEDGGLIFEPDGLQAQAGNLTITYSNPSPVPHSLAVEGGRDSARPRRTGGRSSQLAPGEYVFFCTVPGHREGGMEGDLAMGADEPEAEFLSQQPGSGLNSDWIGAIQHVADHDVRWTARAHRSSSGSQPRLGRACPSRARVRRGMREIEEGVTQPGWSATDDPRRYGGASYWEVRLALGQLDSRIQQIVESRR